ncbi:MAG: permease, partial [Beijerinckiaceae bacterium]|nr:permease [Beijerinckiaceae bacterium]
MSLAFFARHELRLAWRDAVMMLQGGRRRRFPVAAIAVAVFVVVLHLVAYELLEPAQALIRAPDKAFLVALTGSALLAWMLLLAQAMETVTRSFYARADLDLILSSPAPAARLFAVRIAANALSAAIMAALLIGPVVDVAAFLVGPRLLSAYVVVIAMGVSAAAAAVATTALMFRLVGPKRTRLVAQIAAAVIGAGFVVGIQIAAVASAGSLSRSTLLASPAV